MSTLCTPDGPARRGDLHEVGNQESSGASGDMNYEIRIIWTKDSFFLRNYKPTNRRIRFSQAKKHETTPTWNNRKNKQKNMSWMMGLSFTSKLFGSNERCSDFWNWRWILMRHVSHMELQQSIRWVAGVSRVGPSWFLLMSVFSCRKKVKWFSLTSKPGSSWWSLWSLATSSKLWCCSLAENRGGRWVGSLWSRWKWRMKSSLKITI